MISENIPEGFKAQLEVVSCYVECDGQLLLLQRHPEHKHSSKWGLPAGKLERGESIEQGILREIQEETGLVMNVNDVAYRESLFVSHEGKEFLYHVYYTQLQEKSNVTINPPEHAAYGWFTPQQAMKMNLIHDLDSCIERHFILGRV